jgi:hypothetical protein
MTNCMIHEPCGATYPSTAYMKNGKCSKWYPHNFNPTTQTNDDKYPKYQWRDNGCTFVDARGDAIDNRWVVPHNLWLSTKYNAHINLEVRYSTADTCPRCVKFVAYMFLHRSARPSKLWSTSLNMSTKGMIALQRCFKDQSMKWNNTSTFTMCRLWRPFGDSLNSSYIWDRLWLHDYRSTCQMSIASLSTPMSHLLKWLPAQQITRQP